MAGQKSGDAPGKTPYEPGGAEVWSDAPRYDYFNDPYFHREASVEQSQQQRKDVKRLDKLENAPSFNSGGMVKHGSSTRVTCKTKG